MLCSKTRGLGAGRKLRNHRREQLWADKDYKKGHLGNEWKKPFAGASHAKGIVLEKMYVLELSYAGQKTAWTMQTQQLHAVEGCCAVALLCILRVFLHWFVFVQ